jgi:hypothetical protein
VGVLSCGGSGCAIRIVTRVLWFPLNEVLAAALLACLHAPTHTEFPQVKAEIAVPQGHSVEFWSVTLE